MEFHPIANVFPLIEGEDFKKLVVDIKAHGLLEPITTHEGMILDGRNRYRACMEAGVAVRSHEWNGEGGTLAQFIWSKNAERRQLNPSQKALAAQALMPYLAKEAKERQRDHGDTAPGKPKLTLPPNSEEVLNPNPHAGEAAKQAAKAFGVGKSTIYLAKMLVKQAENDPKAAELVKQVQAGRISVHHAGNVLAAQNANAPKPPSQFKPSAPTPPALTVDDEHAAALRRSRSTLALVSAPPAEDASDAAKTHYQSRPVRVLADWLGGLRRDMSTQQITTITPEALEAWWASAEAREWEQTQAFVAWFEQTCAPMLKFVHYKVDCHSTPPMVKRINRRRPS